MKSIFKIIIFFSLFLAKNVFAVCPLCTFVVGASLGLSEYIGLDDAISGLWIGGFLLSLVYWTDDFFKRHKINFSGCFLLTFFFYYFFVLFPLYLKGFFSSSLNVIFGFNKLLFGITLGSVLFFLAKFSYDLTKAKRGRVFFPYQKVIVPVCLLLIASFVVYFIV